MTYKQEAAKEKRFIAMTSVIAAIFLTTFKIIMGL
jgi:divalent metal cation (Fe/Co/Zn/Cd) transporter